MPNGGHRPKEKDAKIVFANALLICFVTIAATVRGLVCEALAIREKPIFDWVEGLSINTYYGVVLPMLAAMVLSTCYALYRERKNRELSVSEIALPGLAIWYFLYPGWIYPGTLGGLIKWSCVILCGAYIIVRCGRTVYFYLQLKLKRRSEMNRKGGFIVSSARHYEDGRRDYAYSVAQKIRRTKPSKESIALGINGSWGSGKTVFLDYIKENLSQEFLVIDFNPWARIKPQRISESFFLTLSSEIYPFSHDISGLLRRYGAMLLQSYADGVLKTSVGVLTGKIFGSASVLKEKISDTLEKTDKRVLVMIDDLDRMDGEEILEVLKLVRNTANFRNVNYVLAYDREYVTKMLDKAGIYNSDRYLDKIFTSEVSLQLCDTKNLMDVISSRVIGYLQEEGPSFALKEALEFFWCNSYGKEIEPHINTYRSAIHFTNLLQSEIEHMIRTNTIEDILFKDFFWLQLLRYKHQAVYNGLKHRDSPYIHDAGGIWELAESNYEELNNKQALSKPCFIILKELFQRTVPPKRSVSHAVSYPYYFSFKRSSAIVTKEGFDTMLDSSNRKPYFQEWLNNESSCESVIRFLENPVLNYTNGQVDDKNVHDENRRIMGAHVDFIIEWFLASGDFKLLPVLKYLRNKDEHKLCFSGEEAFYEMVEASFQKDLIKPEANQELYVQLYLYLSLLDHPNYMLTTKEKYLSGGCLEVMAGSLIDRFYGDIEVSDFFDIDSGICTLMKRSYVPKSCHDAYGTPYNYLWGAVLLKLMFKKKSKDLSKFVKYWGNVGSDVFQSETGIVSTTTNRDVVLLVFQDSDMLREFIEQNFDATDDEKSLAVQTLLK